MYTIKQYETLALEFEKKYVFRTDPVGTTNEGKLEMEYWNLVSDAKCKGILI